MIQQYIKNQHPLKNTGFKKPSLRFHYGKRAHHIMGITVPDWKSFLPTTETQKFIDKETNACMTFSSTNILETQLDYLMSIGQIPADILLWCTENGYLDVNGHWNFSDRFSAIMNGTNPSQGNSFDPVWNGYQKYGLLPDKDFTYTNEQTQKFLTISAFWDDFYNKNFITQSMLEKAKEFLKYFEIRWHYEIIDGTNRITKGIWDFFTGNKGTQFSILYDALRTAPVQIALAACPSWNSGHVLYCGNTQAAHGVMLYNISPQNEYLIFDQYGPYLKSLSQDYVIPYAVLATIRPISKPIHTFAVNLKQWDKNEEVVWLQKCLAYLKLFTLNPTGLYGSVTASAVLEFQALHGISPISEQNVGPKTRMVLNSLFS